MAKYSGAPVAVAASSGEVFERISDLSSFQQRLEQLPEQARAQLGDLKFTSDSIVINAPAVGQMKFNIVERVANERITLAAEGSPVPFAINIGISSDGVDSGCVISTDLDVDIPMMLKPLIGGKMQEAANKFGEMLGTLFG